MLKTMFSSAILIATLITSSVAGTVESIDPAHPSRDNPDEIIRINGGAPTHVHFKTFGSDKIAQAQAFGKSVAQDPNRERVTREKAFEMYPDDPFFQKAFRQFAQ
jgi:hypothetical protein